jgi:anti-anti-sigma factor
MTDETKKRFYYEVEETEDEAKYITTTIKCHGRLTNEYNTQLRELVRPLITRGGHIILDFKDLDFLDSTGLGAIVGLKVSAMNRGLCVLELRNLSPLVRDILRVTNMLDLFKA